MPGSICFCGIANWFIFLDHIPDNVVNWITVRNYGFSGAADMFVFISGYTAAIVYARMTLERGFVVGATRIFKRVWQLYAAYIVLFVIYIVTITRRGDAICRARHHLRIQRRRPGRSPDPDRWSTGCCWNPRPLNLDILQLYIVLVAFFPPVLWLMLRKPGPDAGRIGRAVFRRARSSNGTCRRFPDGNWYFNPFCWQLLFVLGAWFALGGAEKCRIVLEITDPVLSRDRLSGVCSGNDDGRTFPGTCGSMFPAWLFDAFNPNDKENLAPYRVLHFIVGGVDRDAIRAEGLARTGMADLQAADHMRPAIACGVLRRGFPLLCRPFRADDEFGLAAGADFRQRWPASPS